MQRQYFQTIPVSGNPAFISSGGIIVPNKARTTPILEKFKVKWKLVLLSKMKILHCTPEAYINRCALEILLATRLQ
jgi:hypothetical protein